MPASNLRIRDSRAKMTVIQENVAAMHNNIKEDPHVTYRETVASLGISKT